MIYKPSTPYYAEFTTTHPTTGAAQNADTLPVATATKNGVDDGTFALTVTNMDAGRYKLTGTVPAGYVAGDRVQITVAATVNSVAGKAVVGNIFIDTSYISDNATTTTAIKAKTDNLPASPAATGAAMTLTSAYDAAKSAASQSSVTAITTNTARGRSVVPDQIFRPASGSTTYEFDLNLYTLQGGMETPDSAPTIHARNAAGTNLDASLASTTMTNISTGRYKVGFNVASTDAIQEILLDFTWIVGGVTFILSDYVFVVDVYAVDFTSSDRAALAAIPTNPLLTTDSRLNHLNADISALPSDASVAAAILSNPAHLLATDSAGGVSATNAVTLATAQRVKLDASQPDYAPAKVVDVTNAITAIIAAIPAAPDNAGIATLEARLTATRAALLDMLAPADIAVPVVVIPAPSMGGMQVLYGHVKMLGTTWAAWDMITITPASQNIGTNVLSTTPQQMLVAADGSFSFEVDKGAKVTVEASHPYGTTGNLSVKYFTKTFTVSNADQADLTSY